jgi:hypothetical protein
VAPESRNVDDIPCCVIPLKLFKKLVLEVGAVYVVTNLLINFGWVFDTVNSDSMTLCSCKWGVVEDGLMSLPDQ